MRRTVAAGLLATLVGSACASGHSTGPAPAHWDRPSADLATLTLDPRSVRFVRTPDERPLRLAIGGVFVRHTVARGHEDAIGFLIVLEDEGADAIDGAEARLHLEIDQVRFDGGATPRGVLRTSGHRSSFMVEVSPAVLEALVGARTVRGRIGSSVAFVLPPENRQPFRDLLDRLPRDAFASASR